MMRLSTLWRVVRALDATDRRGTIADQLVAQWEHDSDPPRLVRASANFVCRFHARGADRFLRFADSSERTRGIVEGEIDLLGWLDESGMAVARPVCSTSGDLVETVDTDLGTFHTVVFEGVPGTHLQIERLDSHRFQDWGAALGRLHAATANYSGPALATRLTWHDQLDRARPHIPTDQSAIRRELDELAAALAALPVDRERFGLIHGDFELDNLCWPDRGGRAPGILDFDDCARHWYAADLAFALRDLFDDGADLGHPSVGAFVGGYRAHFPLGDEMLAALPLFSRLSRLLVYAKLVRSLDLPDRPDQPEWLRALRRKFEARITAYAASLAR